jgi:hypothetical protein
MPRLRSIANVVKLSGCEVPDWMLAIKPVRFVFCCADFTPVLLARKAVRMKYCVLNL